MSSISDSGEERLPFNRKEPLVEPEPEVALSAGLVGVSGQEEENRTGQR